MHRASLPFVLLSVLILAWDSPARACGGCFHQPPAPNEVESVITDHRMVFSISTEQSILWDQIRYSGAPSEFAWVLPVHQGAELQLSHDEWIAALDASTATVISGPTPPNCPGSLGGTDVSSGGGCGFGSTADATSLAGGGYSPSEPPDAAGNSQVTVVGEAVVGPYEEVTVRSSQGEALGDWLRANGFDVPASTQPVIDAYVAEGFDFIALKLRPNESVNAMQPVRVVTPGADLTLPLRMVAAGIGAHVGITLFVISEGRYHPANFPDATIDFTQLTWDAVTNRSDYSELAAAALAAGDGSGWLTESSQAPSLTRYANPSATNPGLAAAYLGTCQPIPVPAPPCASVADAGADSATAADAGADADATSDGGDDAGGDAGEDAGTDASSPPSAPDAGCQPPTVVACDDLDVALAGMAEGNIVVTRLRADLPASALANDLVLGAAPSQASVPNVHHTDTYSDPSKAPTCPNASTASSSSPSSSGDCACKAMPEVHARAGAWLLALVAAFGLVRRRR
jgi:MYXO-CTERM domain-containing protein